MFRKMMYLTSLMTVVVMLSACGANIRINPFTAEETVTQSFTPAAAPRIVVEMFNGSVDVVTGSDNTVKVDVIKRGGGMSQAAAEDDLKNVEVTMTQDGDTIRVVAKRTDQRVDLGNTGASAKLRVPNGAILDLRSSNGADHHLRPGERRDGADLQRPDQCARLARPTRSEHEQRADHDQRRQRPDRRRDQQRPDRDYGGQCGRRRPHQQRAVPLHRNAGARPQ